MRVSRTQSAALGASKPSNHQWMYHGARISASTMAEPSTRYMVALKASASMPRPKSQAMYLMRTRPMMRDRKVEAISTRVAVKAVCA